MLNTTRIAAAVLAAALFPSVGASQQLSEQDRETLAVLRAAVTQTRTEFTGKLFVGAEDWVAEAMKRDLLPEAAQVLGVEHASPDDVFHCVGLPSGGSRCEGKGVFLTPETPTFQGDSATIWLHYTEARPDGGIPTVSIKLLLMRRGSSWHVERELERRFTRAG